MNHSNIVESSTNPSKGRMLPARRGNLLVGCGVVLLILIILVGVGAYFVYSNVRGWTADASTKAIDKMLTEAQIDPAEHAEIMVHVESLMTRFEDGDIEWNQLGQVVEQLAKSPVISSAMVISIDRLYVAQSELPEEEKAQARIDLARYTQGLFDKSIEPDSINDVLEPAITHSPDDNDIRLNLKIDENGRTITALKSADQVSTEELRELIASAKALADEAGVTETPEPVDLSDEVQKAIGIALGEIAQDVDVEVEADEPATDEPADPAMPQDDDGP
jgi:uncharacterized protein YpmB